MPLSRHFYSLDEVQAALLYNSARGNKQESLFWSYELILSGCVGETISTLFESWLWHCGPYRIRWLIDAWKTLASDELTENDILLASHQLSLINIRDNSIWSILVLYAQNPNKMPDRVTKKTPHILPSNDPKEIYFIRTIFQGKARSAWWISCHLESTRVWELLDWYARNICSIYYKEYTICLEALRNYDKLLGYKSKEYDTIIQCMAILVFCISLETQQKSFMSQPSEIDEYHQQLIKNWKNNIGYKKYRIYTIPSISLYGISQRGISSWNKHNFEQLNNIEKHLIGCPFWNETIAKYAQINDNCDSDEFGKIIWNSEDDMETFYEKYFPDDIPDEWTLAEKKISHGDGVLAPNDTPTLWKYSRNHMMKPQRLAWGLIGNANQFINTLQLDCILTKIIELFDKTLTIENNNLLEPVKRIKII